eukprot:GEMP01060463.1.p2 GENE.GEMP01060463.1~~GEMP01060463.1.p2  ORF type:complete len:197 (+),score=43.97 GEMP01060463.1:79-669(+)
MEPSITVAMEHENWVMRIEKENKINAKVRNQFRIGHLSTAYTDKVNRVDPRAESRCVSVEELLAPPRETWTNKQLFLPETVSGEVGRCAQRRRFSMSKTPKKHTKSAPVLHGGRTNDGRTNAQESALTLELPKLQEPHVSLTQLMSGQEKKVLRSVARLHKRTFAPSTSGIRSSDVSKHVTSFVLSFGHVPFVKGR